MPSKRKSRRPVAVRPAKAKKASTARVASTAAPAPGVALAATMRAINASCEARVQSPFAAVDNFDAFFTKISAHCLASPSPSERAQYFLFLTNCFRSLENVAVREVVLQTTGLASWRSLTAAKLAIELAANPALQQRWAKLAAPRPVDAFMPRLIAHFFSVVDASAPGDASAELKDFVNRFLELIIGVVSQLHTRRFVRPLLDDANFELRCRFAPLLRYSLATKLLDLLHRRLRFEVDDPTGEAKTELEVLQEHYAAVCALQRVAFKHFGAELRELCLSSVGQLGSRAALLAHLEQLSDSQLVALAAHVKLSLGRLADGGNGNGEEGSTASSKASGSVGKRRMALEVLVRSLAKPASRIEQVNALSLYPSEALLWDDERVPFDYRGAGVLALPKLGLHYMTLHDYLERCFTLFRFEAATQIRAHLVSAISRMVPSRVEDRSGAPSARFGGWSRDAVPVSDFELVEVGRPDVGSLVPSVVKATLTISLARFQGPVLGDWCKLQEHDVVFLVAIRPPARPRGAGGGGGGARAPKPGDDPAYATKTGVLFVRGAEVVEVQDGKGETIRRRGASGAGAADAAARGSTRRLVLHLDPAQYTQDQAALAAGRSATASPAAGADGADALLDLQGVLHDDPYGAGVINLLVRRSAKENNFKAVLQTVRDIMNVEAVGKGTALPSWLHDVFLGVGDPAAASPEALPARMHTFDIRSTLVSAQHAAASFPTKTVLFACEGGALVEASEAVAKGVAPPPPYRIRTAKEGSVVLSSSSTFSSAAAAAAAAAAAHARGERERRNAVEFSPTQVRAILSGMNVGLTCVCGPPGTGKTDVAVQIVSNLYANFPKQRILLVAHSNQALNDLFEKITERDIDPRHLIRLGRGERELRERTDADFSINGRVAYTLERRQLLLNNVRRIAETLGVPGASDVAYTCETAEHFQLFHVVSRVEAFELAVAAQASPPPPGSVAALFPFVAYVAASGTTPGLFAGVSFEDDLSAARRSFRQIESMFEELADFRAFELLRTSRQREDYLLTKQARIVALTCTHAALARRRLIRLNFKFDSVIMEEAAQVLDIETFIPLLLQSGGVESTLKRFVLIGDQHQLPPVISNEALASFAHLDQSMFSRFVRSGVPTIQLDAQGRARASLANLYRWRYEQRGASLGDLPLVAEGRYRVANAGCALEYQWVNVTGVESAPRPNMWQSIEEAEYVVAVYRYMRLIGHPASSIAILSTYRGQVSLINDVLAKRVAPYPFFGLPVVSTVDSFQGSAADVVLLSLVRSSTVGFMRDVRRWVVALSRARLGLYIFGNQALYAEVSALDGAFSQLAARPAKLLLVAGERFPTQRGVEDVPKDAVEIAGVAHIGAIVREMEVAAGL